MKAKKTSEPKRGFRVYEDWRDNYKLKIVPFTYAEQPTRYMLLDNRHLFNFVTYLDKKWHRVCTTEEEAVTDYIKRCETRVRIAEEAANAARRKYDTAIRRFRLWV